ncbi:uncharacterized protein LOC117213673 [Bombus bifarius]|uniref:Uncharacterized protein LOC117213673 n=1 Tax=Bombus bifarius TaxID=103933 RepID=A0A6P8MMP7_9HYME|nr:uncharacterized protein LOC117213673 [Bombus bifarius]
MLKRLNNFLKEADLELSTEKTKIVVFEKRRNKRRQRKWKWGEQELEEVDEIRYLGYILQKSGSDEKHIQDRKKRVTIAMKKTWSVGERIFKQDYKRRMKMFGALIESVALFEAEVWGLNMEERLDRVQRGYVKWILGLDMTTPNYILVEECKLIEIKEKVLKRVARYEDEALESKKELLKVDVLSQPDFLTISHITPQNIRKAPHMTEEVKQSQVLSQSNPLTILQLMVDDG